MKYSKIPVIIYNSPESLKLLVQFYRFFGFSFSGILFQTSNPIDGKDRRIAHKKWVIAKSCLIIGWNLTQIANMLFLLVFNLIFVLRLSSYHNRSDLMSRLLSNSTNYLTYELTTGIDEYLEGFNNFKPVLRHILQSLMFIFLLDYLVSFPFSLVKGGQLVQQLVSVPEIRQIDTSKCFALKIFSATVAFFITTSIVGFIAFRGKYFYLFIKWTFGDDEEVSSVSQHDVFNIKRCLALLVVYPFYFIIQSVTTFLFVYMMYIFKKHFELIRLHLPEPVNESALLEMKIKIQTLSRHYHRLLKHFYFPLTVINLINIYLIIASVCYLTIQPDKTQFYTGFILNFGTYGLVRLLVVCCTAGLVGDEYKRLNIKLVERKARWTADEWIQLTEIVKMKKRFSVQIWNTYVLNYSTVLVLTGIALNYICILLSTESYGNTVQ